MFEMELEVRGATEAPVLYLDSEAGDVRRTPLPRPTTGWLRALVHLGTGTTGIQLAPRDGPGEFSLGGAWAEELSSVRGLAEHAIPALKRVFGEPSRLPLMARRLWTVFRLRGAAGVLQRLRALTEERSENRGYAEWAERYVRLDESQREQVRAHMAKFSWRPTISVVVPVSNPDEVFLRRAIDSVSRQLYSGWELCIADASDRPAIRTVLESYRVTDPRIRVLFCPQRGTSAAASSALELATGEFVAFVGQDGELSEQALFAVADALQSQPGSQFLFSDEDSVNSNGDHSTPAFKPGWCPEMLRSQNYIGHLAVYRRERLKSLGGLRSGFEGSENYDLVLRYTEGLAPEQIRQIPAILYHSPTLPASTPLATGTEPVALESAVAAIQESIDRAGRAGRVESGPRPGTYRTRYALPDPLPRVTVIVPTRDRYSLLRRCLEGVQSTTSPASTEILVVDNGTRQRRALAYLNRLEQSGAIRLLRYPGAFNYSAMNNLAAREANGSVLCFLNNDVEVIGTDWLTEMVSLALLNGVGAVGAKLYYPDNGIQHAGMAAGTTGIADHEFRHASRDADGYLMRLNIVREVAAVTAACMVLEKEKFWNVGGFDANELRIGFNDVDLCFRLLEAGYRNLFTPYAELLHRESVSRGSIEEPANRARDAAERDLMRRRWRRLLEAAPYSNPNVSLDSPAPVLAWPPRRRQPWFRPTES